MTQTFRIMRLLRQISLDGNIMHTSAYSKFFTTDETCHLGHNFTHYLSNAITLTIGMLNELKNNTITTEIVEISKTGNDKKDKLSDSAATLLKVLEELNCLIVYLIRQSSDKERVPMKGRGKPKSKLRSHYSAFVESGQFRWVRSLSRQNSDSNVNKLDYKGSSGTSPPTNENLASSPFLDEGTAILGCSLDEAVCKLIDSQILNILLESIPLVGFEEKKMVQRIVTHAMLLQVNNSRPVVDYFGDTTNGLLSTLVRSYELGRSDITLNCGYILRFASQFRRIVLAILQSDLLCAFFEYMQRCPNYPFDVAMDVFYTFKIILTQRKDTITIVQSNPGPFFEALIKLLRHSEVTENYVTKRQTLEIFADIFSCSQCGQMRMKFITENGYICPVIAYLWNRHIQLRLRCLVLLSQLFTVSKLTNTESVSFVPDKVHDDDTKRENSLDKEENGNTSSGAQCNEQPVEKEWRIELLFDKIRKSRYEYSNVKGGQSELTLRGWIHDTFVELRHECCKSRLKHFTSQLPFIDRVIDSIDST